MAISFSRVRFSRVSTPRAPLLTEWITTESDFWALEGDWRALVNQSWAQDWSDPREDIYTLEDGKPSHGPG